MIEQWYEISEIINEHLSPVLDKLGFQLVNHVDDKQVKMLYEYTRSDLHCHLEVDCTPLPENIDDGRREYLWLKIQVTSDIAKTYLKVLSGDTFGKNEYQKTGWVFKDLPELEATLDNISQIANYKLLDWVRNPTSPSKPTIRVNPHQRIEALESRISSLQDELKIAISSNNTERIRQLKTHLENLENMVEKTLREIRK